MVNAAIDNYLLTVRRHLRMDPKTEQKVVDELRTYFQEKVDDLSSANIGDADPAEVAIKSFGRARRVARLMYEAHSKGSWGEALLASIPHFTVAFLFSLHLWRHPILSPLLLVVIVSVSLYGWWGGKPNWVYSWVGYSMAPLLIVAFQFQPEIAGIYDYLVLRTGQPLSVWLFALVIGFCGFSLWVVLSTTHRVIKRDWVLATLMLVPLPILGGWLHSVGLIGGLFQETTPALYAWDLPLSYVFALFGVSAVVFIRLRQRVWKAAAVITIAVVTGAYLVRSFWEVGFASLLVTAGGLLLFLLLPALLDLPFGHQREDRACDAETPQL